MSADEMMGDACVAPTARRGRTCPVRFLAALLLANALAAQTVDVVKVVSKKSATKVGMMMTMIQAPSWNFVTAKATATAAVSTAPTPLVSILRRQSRSCSRTVSFSVMTVPGGRRPTFHQRRVMPACESVKDRNTPIAYSGMRAVTLALKTTMRTIAITARARIPREKTRRLPR